MGKVRAKIKQYYGEIKEAIVIASPLFMVAFGILIYFGAVESIDYRKKPIDYNSLLESDVKKNMIVEGDLFCNYGPFEEYKYDGSTCYYYLIEIGEKQYMGIRNYFTNLGKELPLDKQADQTFNYLNGDTSQMPDKVHFKGKVKRLKKEELDFMREYMLSLGFLETEVDSYILPYYVECMNFGDGLLAIGIGIFFFIIFGIVFVKHIDGFKLAEIEEKKVEMPTYEEAFGDRYNEYYNEKCN